MGTESEKKIVSPDVKKYMKLFHQAMTENNITPFPSGQNCHFYLFLGNRPSCLKDPWNYDHKKGFKFCEMFLNIEKKLRVQGPDQDILYANFLNNTRSCLLTKRWIIYLRDNQDCEGTYSSAIDTHTVCYEQAGFCELPFTNKLQIARTIGLDFFQLEVMKEAAEMMMICAQKKCRNILKTFYSKTKMP